jgi:hypothetical protein
MRELLPLLDEGGTERRQVPLRLIIRSAASPQSIPEKRAALEDRPRIEWGKFFAIEAISQAVRRVAQESRIGPPQCRQVMPWLRA